MDNQIKTIKDLESYIFADETDRESTVTLSVSMLQCLYYFAQAKSATEYGKRVQAHLEAQQKRADKCRYYHLADSILHEPGTPDAYKNIVYHPDFGGAEFWAESEEDTITTGPKAGAIE